MINREKPSGKAGQAPLAPASTQSQDRNLTLNFESIPKRHRTALKHVIYTSLSGPLPPNEARPSMKSVVSRFYNLGVFLRWLNEAHPGVELPAITTDILRGFDSHVRLTYPSADRRNVLRSSVTYLWRYRRHLDGSALSTDPRTLSGWIEIVPGATENLTPRIPEEVSGPLLVWAMRFVDDFSNDIRTAFEIWARDRAPKPPSRTASGEALERFRSYLNGRYATSSALPGANGQLSWIALSRKCRVDRSTLRNYQSEIDKAVADLGVSDFSTLDVPISGLLDDTPWLAGVSVDLSRDDSLVVLAQVLQAACYIVIAYLSGMRDSEIKHIRAGSVEVLRNDNGRPYRWLVSSLAFKGEASSAGVPAIWVIGEPAARAIEVLTRMHHVNSNSDWLFAPIACGPGNGSGGRQGNIAMTYAGTNRQLNRFVAWVNAYCKEHGRDDRIPDHGGEPWKLSTRQFRRTLAWFIARQPGGSIAGAIAYRHHSVHMFEGYAGTSDSGFRAEVEAEQALQRGEYLLSMADQHQHESLAGPAAEDAAQRLRAMADNPGFAGTVTTDRRRLLRLINVHGPAVYPGKYVTCVYTHSRALCRPRDDSNTRGPDRSNCKPLSCTNVALTADNIREWDIELEQLDREIADGDSLPPALLARLRERREQILALTQEQD